MKLLSLSLAGLKRRSRFSQLWVIGVALALVAAATLNLFSATPQRANAALLARDNFEYQVDRTGDITNFYTQGIWAYAKTSQTHNSQSSTLYTTTSIPGYTGSFPGTNSSRVLAMELLPDEVMPGWRQTDVYLQYGGQSFPAGTIPADHWVQFWFYINRSGDEISELTSGKFLYYSADGLYPVQTELSQSLVSMRGADSYNPYFTPTEGPGQFYFVNRSFTADYAPAPEWDQNKMGINLGSSGRPGRIDPNTWYLVKMHIDTSGASPLAPAGQDVWEMWIRRVDTSFVKVAEWIGGVTPDFTWPVIDTTGYKTLRIPTTVDDVNSWLYMDDFALATLESDLPVYPISSLTERVYLSLILR